MVTTSFRTGEIMSVSTPAKLFDLALSMLKTTSPYTKSIETMVYTYLSDVGEETIDFCQILKRNLSAKKYETGRASSHKKICRKCIEQIEATMIYYMEDYPGPYSVVQHHRNVFGQWLLTIVDRYGQGMEFDLPKELQYENENQNTAVLLLKELQNRNGVTKNDLQEKLRLKPRQIAKDLRKLDHSLIETPEAADMSDYVPFRIGGQPVKAKISAVRKGGTPGGRELYFKTVNSVHPIVLQENLMQTGTLLQALCRNYFEHENGTSLSIATDIWYQLSAYAKSRIKQVFVSDSDIKDFIDIIEGDFPAGNRELFMTERRMLREFDLSDEELLMYYVKVPGRRCNITIRDASGTERTLYDQSISIQPDNEGRVIYIAAGRDGTEVRFSKNEFFAAEDCSSQADLSENMS